MTSVKGEYDTRINELKDRQDLNSFFVTIQRQEQSLLPLGEG